MLAGLPREAGAGLRQIFAHCEDFDARADLLAWMRAHSMTPPTAIYVNWVGRTVRQMREEAALHDALRERACGMTRRQRQSPHGICTAAARLPCARMVQR